jgi:hypothetical protein
MTFRKADESLVCSDKTLTVSSNLHYYVEKQVQLLSLLSKNKDIVFLYFKSLLCYLFSSAFFIKFLCLPFASLIQIVC